MAEFKYWAFLSYSHKDRKWGDWLHKALETYRLPRRLIGKESRDGKVPQRVYPIFRDREELPVSADLGTNINEALRESRHLIVICSPHAAQSRWVGEEIKTYKKLGREDRILALIVDGEPNASDGKAGLKIEDECFPEAMRYRVARDGTLSPQRTEPIAADTREGKDGKNNAKLKLLAGLLGISYDDLRRRDHERRLRRARAVGAVALVLVLIFAGLAVALFYKSREANRQKQEAVRNANEARHQETKAKNTSVQADYDLAIIYRQKSETVDSRVLAHLARALQTSGDARLPRQYLVSLLRDIDWHVPETEPMRHEGAVWAASFSPDGRRIVTASFDKSARVWDAESGKAVGEPMRHEASVYAARFSPDGRRIVTASGDKTARVWDAESGKPVGEPMRHEDSVVAASFSPDGRRIVTASGDDTARVWDAESGKAVGEPMHHEDAVRAASFSPDGRRIVTASRDNTARVWDVTVDIDLPLPSWVPELAEALGGRKFNEEGQLVPPPKGLVELRKEVLALKGDDFWSRLGRWFFMRGPNRTISPDSKITVGELDRLRAKAGEKENAKPPEPKPTAAK